MDDAADGLEVAVGLVAAGDVEFVVDASTTVMDSFCPRLQWGPTVQM